MREMTDAELDQVCGGLTGGGVITAFTEGETRAVLNAVEGLTTATAEPGPNPVGHGLLETAPGA